MKAGNVYGWNLRREEGFFSQDALTFNRCCMYRSDQQHHRLFRLQWQNNCCKEEYLWRIDWASLLFHGDLETDKSHKEHQHREGQTVITLFTDLNNKNTDVCWSQVSNDPMIQGGDELCEALTAERAWDVKWEVKWIEFILKGPVCTFVLRGCRSSILLIWLLRYTELACGLIDGDTTWIQPPERSWVCTKYNNQSLPITH